MPGAATYNVYRRAQDEERFTLVFSTSGISAVDDAIGSGRFSYTLTAVDREGRESVLSEEESVVVKLSEIPWPTTRLWQVYDKRGSEDEGGQDDLLGDGFDLAYDRAADLLYVSSTFHRSVLVLRGRDGAVLRRIGPRLGNHEIGLPLGLDVDGDGNLYLVDGKQNVVVVLTREGVPLRMMKAALLADEREQRLIGVAALPGGIACVTDNANGRVIVLDDAGREIRRWWLPPREDGKPAALTQIAATPEGNLVVVDGIASRLHLVSPFGLIGSFGENRVSMDGLIHLRDVVPLVTGDMLVADRMFARGFGLARRPGSYRYHLANSRGRGNIAVFAPIAIAAGEGGPIFVLDQWGTRVSAHRLEGILGPR